MRHGVCHSYPHRDVTLPRVAAPPPQPPIPRRSTDDRSAFDSSPDALPHQPVPALPVRLVRPVEGPAGCRAGAGHQFRGRRSARGRGRGFGTLAERAPIDREVGVSSAPVPLLLTVHAPLIQTGPSPAQSASRAPKTRAPRRRSAGECHTRPRNPPSLGRRCRTPAHTGGPVPSVMGPVAPGSVAVRS